MKTEVEGIISSSQNEVTAKEKEAAVTTVNSNSYNYNIDRCFLIEVLLRCLGIETRTHQSCSSSSSSSSSEQNINGEVEEYGKEPSSTTELDPSTDPPLITEDIGRVPARIKPPPKPPVSSGSGPQIN
ncbi:uncharacterized protein LOC8281435 [Ricinus communis]|uniref:Uncharacterized protein n=1 Tax=Ricinus communis TaxID=3988 RepID=B9SMB5_RICCO|nr:uncharacterized protein LOC8281435 [Ricinus communis]EEF35297.1 conserved hypothetical protein [Ricinus communis]|eukprot:XP_002527134.1 uncharacterized protein LOC8281435 [Ricinus communis]